MIDGYAREAGVRSLENNIKKLLRKAARKIVEDGQEKFLSADQNFQIIWASECLPKKPVSKNPKSGSSPAWPILRWEERLSY